MNKML